MTECMNCVLRSRSWIEYKKFVFVFSLLFRELGNVQFSLNFSGLVINNNNVEVLFVLFCKWTDFYKILKQNQWQYIKSSLSISLSIFYGRLLMRWISKYVHTYIRFFPIKIIFSFEIAKTIFSFVLQDTLRHEVI